MSDDRDLVIDDAAACKAALGAIRWTSGPVRWPNRRSVLDVAIRALPLIEDDVTADLVERLALSLVDQQDELRAVRAVLSEALALAHTQDREIARLGRVYRAALDDVRQRRHEARQTP